MPFEAPMSTEEASLHVIDASNASLLDRLDDDVFDHPVQPALLQAFLAQPSNHLVVAVVEGQVVGMASGLSYVHPDKPLSMFINEVGVAARFQRRGLARRLVNALLEHARCLGCDQAWVATEAGNVPARALYEALGGQADDEPAIVYVYPLATAPAPDPGAVGH
jgi:ribosomal protein S18 acetylase RimI-like enzyme